MPADLCRLSDLPGLFAGVERCRDGPELLPDQLVVALRLCHAVLQTGPTADNREVDGVLGGMMEGGMEGGRGRQGGGGGGGREWREGRRGGREGREGRGDEGGRGRGRVGGKEGGRGSWRERMGSWREGMGDEGKRGRGREGGGAHSDGGVEASETTFEGMHPLFSLLGILGCMRERERERERGWEEEGERLNPDKRHITICQDRTQACVQCIRRGRHTTQHKRHARVCCTTHKVHKVHTCIAQQNRPPPPQQEGGIGPLEEH